MSDGSLSTLAALFTGGGAGAALGGTVATTVNWLLNRRLQDADVAGKHVANAGQLLDQLDREREVHAKEIRTLRKTVDRLQGEAKDAREIREMLHLVLQANERFLEVAGADPKVVELQQLHTVMSWARAYDNGSRE